MNEKLVSDKERTTVDWSEIYRKIENVQAAIERGWTPTAEEKKRILRTRAKALAQEAKEEETAKDYVEVVEFLLSYERYGVESSYVREVYPLKELTPVPCTPPFVLGIINVRGHILSVINIKKFFDLPEKGLTDLNKVIILQSEGPALSRVKGMAFGILADAVLGVRNIMVSALQPAPTTLTGIREDYLRGITDEQVVVLDAEKLLSDRKIVIHEEV
jgi:purine-binding chemotaxis protein CheW